jgi:hypothetical protein
MKMLFKEAKDVLSRNGLKLIKEKASVLTGIGNYPDPKGADDDWDSFEAAVLSVKDGGTGRWTIDGDEGDNLHPRFRNYAHALAALKYTGSATDFEGDCEEYLDKAVNALNLKGLEAFRGCDRDFIYSVKDPNGNVLL